MADYNALGYIFQNGQWYARDGSPVGGGVAPVTASGGQAMPVAIQTLGAGERSVGSAGNSYLVTRNETNGTIVTGTTAAVTLSAAPAHLQRIMPLNAALVGTVTITGLTDQSGNPVPVVIPAGAAANAPVDFSWARCETSLSITLSNAGDKVLVNWRPL